MTETSIHVKLEYSEALNSKRNLLLSQKNLLRSSKFMGRYYSLRINELQIQAKLHREIKETLAEIGKINSFFPKAEVPQILKKEKEEYSSSKKVREKTEKYNRDIETELAEIQKKLSMLQ